MTAGETLILGIILMRCTSDWWGFFFISLAIIRFLISLAERLPT